MPRTMHDGHSDGHRAAGFLDTKLRNQPSVFIQWKGTDACFDFECDCGWGGHFDGDFAYLVKCGGCGQVWEMPCLLYPRKSQRDDGMPPVEPRASEDEEFELP